MTIESDMRDILNDLKKIVPPSWGMKNVTFKGTVQLENKHA